MTKVLGLLAFVAALIGCTKENMQLSEQTKAQIEFEIQQKFSGLIEASNTLDPERYFEFFDKENFSGLNADGTNWNTFTEFRELIELGFAMVEQSQALTFTNVTITAIDANTAILVNEYEQRLLLKNGNVAVDAGGGTQVWSKSSGDWKLVSVSASAKVK